MKQKVRGSEDSLRRLPENLRLLGEGYAYLFNDFHLSYKMLHIYRSIEKKEFKEYDSDWVNS